MAPISLSLSDAVIIPGATTLYMILASVLAPGLGLAFLLFASRRARGRLRLFHTGLSFAKRFDPAGRRAELLVGAAHTGRKLKPLSTLGTFAEPALVLQSNCELKPHRPEQRGGIDDIAHLAGLRSPVHAHVRPLLEAPVHDLLDVG